MNAMERALDILERNDRCSLSTFSKEGEQPCIAIVNYFNDHLDVFVIMDTKSLKCKNIREHKKVAVVIDDEADQGSLQFFGMADEIDKIPFVKEHPELEKPDRSLIKIVPFDIKVSVSKDQMHKVDLE